MPATGVCGLRMEHVQQHAVIHGPGFVRNHRSVQVQPQKQNLVQTHHVKELGTIGQTGTNAKLHVVVANKKGQEHVKALENVTVIRRKPADAVPMFVQVFGTIGQIGVIARLHVEVVKKKGQGHVEAQDNVMVIQEKPENAILKLVQDHGDLGTHGTFAVRNVVADSEQGQEHVKAIIVVAILPNLVSATLMNATLVGYRGRNGEDVINLVDQDIVKG